MFLAGTVGAGELLRGGAIAVLVVACSLLLIRAALRTLYPPGNPDEALRRNQRPVSFTPTLVALLWVVLLTGCGFYLVTELVRD